MLTRLLQKVQQFVIQNPVSATTFYTSLNELFISEVEKINQLQFNNSRVIATVKNPLIVRGKGRPSNKRITGVGESANKTNKKKKTNENVNSNTPELIVSLDKPIHVAQNTQVMVPQPLHEIQNLNVTPFISPSQFPRFSEPSFFSDELNLGKCIYITFMFESIFLF